MRVLLLTSGQPNQVALAQKIAARWNLVGIVIENRPQKKKKESLLKRGLDFLLFFKINNAWKQLMNHYKTLFPVFPELASMHTASINDNAVKEFTLQMKPDVVLVSGTSLLKKSLLEIPLPLGMLNLHTGLSPYIKGGPNCTNWCIASGQLHYIGNTIMWIDAGIDSGDLLLTDTVRFSGNESLFALHLKVMEAAHQLYLQALERVASGHARRVAQQSIASGKIYYTKDWGANEKRSLLRNFKKFNSEVATGQYLQDIQNVQLVK